jgi:uncharacterized Zn finger protein (UPF0148 family)
MPDATLEKQACRKCGADVRDGTSFCYACGADVSAVFEEPAPEPRIETVEETAPAAEPAVTDELPKEEKPASAAMSRRKSRRDKRKPKKIVWEEPSERSNRVFVLVTLLIFAVAVFVVAFTVLVK